MNLAKPKKVKSIAVAGNHNLYNYLKLRYLQKLVTTNTLTPCSIATDGLLYHRLSSLTSTVAHREDGRVESRDPDSRFQQPVLTVNALHTSIHEPARTYGLGTVELSATAEEVINISSIHSTYFKPDVQNARLQ